MQSGQEMGEGPVSETTALLSVRARAMGLSEQDVCVCECACLCILELLEQEEIREMMNHVQPVYTKRQSLT